MHGLLLDLTGGPGGGDKKSYIEQQRQRPSFRPWHIWGWGGAVTGTLLGSERGRRVYETRLEVGRTIKTSPVVTQVYFLVEEL